MEREHALIVVDRRGNIVQSDQHDPEPASAITATPTPSDLLRIAMDQNADLDKLEKLMELQFRWEANEAKKAFITAMAAFKAECPKILPRDGTVNYPDAKGNRVRYRHSTLGGISEVITPILSKHGLSVTFDSKQSKDGITITCEVMHTGGHAIKRSLTAPPDNSGRKNSIQAICSTATYLSRYTEVLALGLATEKDDDGQSAIPTPELHQEQPKPSQGQPKPSQGQPKPSQEQPKPSQEQRVQRVITKFKAKFAVIQTDIEQFLRGAEDEPPLPAAEWRDAEFDKLTALHEELCKIPPGPNRVKAVRKKFGLPSSALKG